MAAAYLWLIVLGFAVFAASEEMPRFFGNAEWSQENGTEPNFNMPAVMTSSSISGESESLDDESNLNDTQDPFTFGEAVTTTLVSGNTSTNDAQDVENQNIDSSPAPTKEMKLSVEASKYLAFKIGLYSHLYYLPVVIAVGLVGNTLSLVVMLLRRNRRTSCCVYMAALAVSDNVTLATGLWARVVMSFPAGWSIFPWGCRMIAYTYNSSTWYSILLVLAMTVDKCIAVTFPLRAPSLCIPSRAKVTIIATGLLALLYNIHHPFLAKPVGTICSAYGVQNLGSKIFPWVSTALNFIIPFTAIFIMNLLIIRSMKNRGKNLMNSIRETQQDHAKSQPSTSSTSMKTGQVQNKDAQLTAMLLTVTFALLVFGLPIFLRNIVYAILDKNSTAYNLAVYTLVFHLSNKLYWTNSAVNFFCYCISGKRFRRDVLIVLRLDKCRAGAEGPPSDVRVSSSQQTLSTVDQASPGNDRFVSRNNFT